MTWAHATAGSFMGRGEGIEQKLDYDFLVCGEKFTCSL